MRRNNQIQFVANSSSRDGHAVPDRDENEQAVRNVEKATESEPVQGEDLLESEKLKRELLEAKKHAKSASRHRARPRSE